MEVKVVYFDASRRAASSDMSYTQKKVNSTALLARWIFSPISLVVP